MYSGGKFGVRDLEARSWVLSIAVEGGEVTHRKPCLQKQLRVGQRKEGGAQCVMRVHEGASLGGRCWPQEQVPWRSG